MANENEYEMDFEDTEEKSESQQIFTLHPKEEPNLPISLENFNPLDPRKRITSPLSLTICKANGVLPSKLFHCTYEEIKNRIHPLKRTDAEYLKMKYIETENQRQKLVEHLRALRRAAIQESSQCTQTPTNGLQRKPKVSSYSMLTTCMMRTSQNNTSQLLPDPKKEYQLDKSVVQYERRRVEAKMAKEIRILMAKAQKSEMCKPFNQRKNRSFIGNYENYLEAGKENKYTTKKVRHNLSMISSKEADALSRLENVEQASKKIKEMQIRIQKKRKIFNALQEEQHRETQEVVKRVNNYKREQLLDRISRHRDKTVTLQRKREELAKLRQKIRKNAEFQKYVVKSEIEKSMVQFKEPKVDIRLLPDKLRFSNWHDEVKSFTKNLTPLDWRLKSKISTAIPRSEMTKSPNSGFP